MSSKPNSKSDTEKAVKESPVFPISKEFLEFTFEKEVEKFEVNVGSKPGDNYMSSIFAISVVFKNDPTEKHYVMKGYPNHPSRQDILDQMTIFQKELFIYNEFFPALQKTINESGASETITDLSFAPIHGGNASVSPSEKYKNSPWAKENFIILTDMRKVGYKMGDRLTGVDLDHAFLVLNRMAKLHAISWALKQQNGWKRFSDSLPRIRDEVYANRELMAQWKVLISQIANSAYTILEETLGVDHPAIQHLKKLIEEDMDEFMLNFTNPFDVTEDYFEAKLRVKAHDNDPKYNKDPWLVATHGDCWLNNMLFRYGVEENSEKPIDVVFVDFQVYRETCPTADIAYFLNSSVRAPVRNANKDKLLEVYYDSFVQTCKDLNVEPFPGFSFENLKRRYKRAEIFGLLVAMPLLVFVLKPREESIDLDKVDENISVTEVMATIAHGSDTNDALKNEITESVKHLYKMGIL